MPTTASLALAVVASQVADLTARVPKANAVSNAGAPPILKADHVTSKWPITLNELASILNKPLDGLRLLLQLPDGGRWDRSEAREWASELLRQAAPPHPRFPATRLAPPPPRTCMVAAAPPGGRRRASRRSNSVRALRGWLEPARGEFPAPNWPLGPPPVPHMPDFWVTGKPINPLNASVATFCAAGVISMHQTPPVMVRGVSGVSRGRFLTISTGSHSELLLLLLLLLSVDLELPEVQCLGAEPPLQRQELDQKLKGQVSKETLPTAEAAFVRPKTSPRL
jgi:hypothetical protein